MILLNNTFALIICIIEEDYLIIFNLKKSIHYTVTYFIPKVTL